ncbi:winged helix-turn-helix transcriptional regulator [Nocardiopsis trehalosi]|jgi:DNA-binding HxlR family transcriptional regulator|uniref:winged helix-turn-helix transcriptional regulator n=1 Tax=Nocardiopsis trehalosi TaxID=109329 RepID=UPI00082A119F|nr:helix-turn-helix domain-containing protein [Nocardiopsis trehalosi]
MKGTSTEPGIAEETAHAAGPGPITAEHRELLDQVLDKWSLLILDRLCERPRRFNELRRAIPVVTQKSLTAALRRLERNGMVERVVVSSRPVAVEYRIAPLGKTLQGLIEALLRWSTDNMADVERARARFDGERDGEV